MGGAALEEVLPWVRPHFGLGAHAALMGVSGQLRARMRALLQGLREGDDLPVADLGGTPRAAALQGALAFIGTHLAGRVAGLALPPGARIRQPGALAACLGGGLSELRLGDLRGGLGAAVGADLGARCPRLRALHLEGSGPISPALLASFPASHPLEVLAITGCTLEGSSRAVLAALRPLRRLCTLELSRVGPPGSGHLAARDLCDGLLAGKGEQPYPALADLGLAHQPHLAREDFAAVARTAPALRRLDACMGAAPCALDAAVALGRLEVLLLGGCGLADGDVAALAGGACGVRVVELDISQAEALSDDALASLHGCTALRKLTLSRQPKLTAGGLLALLTAAPRLATVVAVRCRRLHRRALALVAGQLLSSTGRSAVLLLEREGGGSSGAQH
ncbi:MAG: hypothetical protein J3K34DRAFT_400059 [Monoraphidium minutum]|nr:MAG: hypothetical protein J3K34DRAFT_400059 [Monoraphidium minutum]